MTSRDTVLAGGLSIKKAESYYLPSKYPTATCSLYVIIIALWIRLSQIQNLPCIFIIVRYSIFTTKVDALFVTTERDASMRATFSFDSIQIIIMLFIRFIVNTPKNSTCNDKLGCLSIFLPQKCVSLLTQQAMISLRSSIISSMHRCEQHSASTPSK